MDWIEAHAVTMSLSTFAIGGFLAFLTNYFLIYLRFSSDIAFIKGQLTEVLKYHENMDEVQINHAKLEKDLSTALLRLKAIEKHILNGGYHGAST